MLLNGYLTIVFDYSTAIFLKFEVISPWHKEVSCLIALGSGVRLELQLGRVKTRLMAMVKDWVKGRVRASELTAVV